MSWRHRALLQHVARRRWLNMQPENKASAAGSTSTDNQARRHAETGVAGKHATAGVSLKTVEILTVAEKTDGFRQV